MKRIALTGGLSTGKSTVGRMFEDLGLPRIDADTLTHQIMVPDTNAYRQILLTFGEKILKNDRTIDRKKLAGIIFKNPLQRKKLEAILHPKVRELMESEIARLEKQGVSKVLLEIPLLFEVGWDKEQSWASIIVVTADEEKQIERAKKKFGLEEAEIRARLQAQLPMSKKTKQADYVIDNNGDLAQTHAQVEAVFGKL